MKAIITFRADMSSFVHIDNKNKDTFILGEEPTQRLDDQLNHINSRSKISY